MAADREAELKIKGVADFGAVTEATGKLTENVEQLGAAGSASGAQLEQAAQGATELGSAENAAAEAAQKAAAAIEAEGDQAVQSAEEAAAAAREQAAAVAAVTEGYVAMASALRGSGSSLEVRKVGLQAIVAEVQQLAQSYIEAGDAEKANLAGQSLIQLKAQLANVNEELAEEIARLREVGETGAAAFGEIKGSTLTFEGAAKGATAAVNGAWEQLNDTYKLTPKTLGLVAQAVESLRIAMTEAAEQGVAATVEQISTYERLEAELQKLTARSNLLTNASKDNAVGLKETGNQVAGLAFGVQQLTQLMGPGAAQFGLLAANAGLAGNAIEGLKDSYKAMGLGAISAGSSVTTLGIAAAGGAAALTAGALAGLKFAESSRANKEAIDSLTGSLTAFWTGVLANMNDRIGASQEALSNLANEFLTLKSDVATLDFDNVSKGLDRVRVAYDAQSIAGNRGREAMRAFMDLINQGIPREEAYAATNEKGSRAVALFTRAHDEGGKALALWNQAVQRSKASGETLEEALAKLTAQMDQETKATLAAAKAKMDLAAAMKAAEDPITKAIEDANKLEVAHAGTTKTINEGVTAILSHIQASDQDSAVLKIYAGALQTVLDGTTKLSPAERERIQSLIDLAQRSGELTKIEQDKAAAISASILSETAAIATTKAHTEATKGLASAKKDLASILDGIAAADAAATASTSALSGALDQQATVVHASAQTLEEEARRKKELATLTAALSQENIQYTQSASQANKIVSDGAGGFTNLSDAQKKADEAMLAAITSGKSFGESIGRDVVAKVEDGRFAVEKMSDSLDPFAEALQQVTTKSIETGKGISSIGIEAEKLPASLVALSEFADGLKLKLLEVEEQARRTATEVRAVGSAVNFAAAEAAAASGQGYNSSAAPGGTNAYPGVTEGP